MPTIYVIGGPNGAGKTTASLKLLPQFLDCIEYVNADAIAAGLSPFNTDAVALQAGRLMLERVNQLAATKVDFAFESTLSSKTFAGFLKKYKNEGYQIVVIYFWLDSVMLSIQRVADRVRKGGHNIPTDTILRRFDRSLKNLVNLYLPLASEWMIYDNSLQSELIADYNTVNNIMVYKQDIWNQILKNGIETQ